MNFKVDEDKCIGCGACTAICESVFEIGDDGLAQAVKEADEKTIDDALSAMEGCPTGAISKEEK